MKTIVTKTGLELLKEKLAVKIEQLKALREEKAHAYTASGDGWHDNPGWTQLGQQEEMQAREIQLLQQKILNAVIIDPALLDSQKVQIGCSVEFQLTKNSHSGLQRMRIVGSGESDVKNKRISFDSPMGSALLNMRVGEEKQVNLPAGMVSLKIKMISYE